jgi:hypothetical protein
MCAAMLEMRLAETMSQLSEQQRLTADARRERDTALEEIARLRVRPVLSCPFSVCAPVVV